MKLPRVRFTIRRFMIVVVGAAVLLTPPAWMSPGEWWTLLTMCCRIALFALFALVVASVFLIGGLEGGVPALRPRWVKPTPLPLILRLVSWPWPDLFNPWRWPDPPHRRKPTRKQGDFRD